MIHLWGKERTLIVTFNPVTRRKKIHYLTRKLDRVRTEILELRRKFNDNLPQWRSEDAVRNHYRDLCEELHISTKFYDLGFDSQNMSFRKNSQEINSAKDFHGKEHERYQQQPLEYERDCPCFLGSIQNPASVPGQQGPFPGSAQSHVSLDRRQDPLSSLDLHDCLVN